MSIEGTNLRNFWGMGFALEMVLSCFLILSQIFPNPLSNRYAFIDAFL
jgi:hypothetical protein